jgi:hypothetical protein
MKASRRPAANRRRSTIQLRQSGTEHAGQGVPGWLQALPGDDAVTIRLPLAATNAVLAEFAPEEIGLLIRLGALRARGVSWREAIVAAALGDRRTIARLEAVLARCAADNARLSAYAQAA